MCRTYGFAPTAELFTALFTACASTKDVQKVGGPEENRFRLRELHAAAKAFRHLASARIDGEMGQELDAEMVLHQQPLLRRRCSGELAAF
jgi:hypothetical protein